MQKIYRALYTRCINGTNFQSSHAFRDGLKLFSTGGDMGLPNEVLSLIETEISRDVYNAGMRPYNGEICRFFSCGGASVLMHYRWMSQEETGSREFGITKALIGGFENHPIEYLSSTFFNGEDFFFDYLDADKNKIISYKQLLTFQGQTPPPLFKPIPSKILFGLENSYRVMSFEDAGSYVLQSKNIAGRLRAAVCHLVKQFDLPDGQRQGIIIKGTPEQIRYWFAAIGYAFSARSAQKIAFSIGLPPVGFSYNFSTASLVGWDIADPDLAKLGNSTPTNLVYLEKLPVADREHYYDAIAKFDDTHAAFVMDFTKRRSEIKPYISFYRNYISLNKYREELHAFANGKTHAFSLDECINNINQYLTSGFFMPNFYSAVLAAANKVSLRSCEDLDKLIDVYSHVEKMIKRDIDAEYAEVVTKANENFKRSFIERFYRIFTEILSDEYSFFNNVSSKKPQEHFENIVCRNQDCAYEIAQRLTQDTAFDKYLFSFDNQRNTVEKSYLTDVVYPRISLVAYMMKWRQSGEPGFAMTEYSARYICKAFNTVLVQYPYTQNRQNEYVEHLADSLDTKTPRIPAQERAGIYKNVFAPFRDKNPINKSGTLGLRAYWDCTYSPKSIDTQSYDDLLEMVFLYNLVAKLEQSGTKAIEQRLEDARAFIRNRLEDGFSEHVLITLYLENHNLENDQSVFYYLYATRLFATNAHHVLLKTILAGLLNRTFRSQRITPDEGMYLSKVVPILSEIKNSDSKNWDVLCKVVDNHIARIFSVYDWESYIVSNKMHLGTISNYLLNDLRLPTSLKINLYQVLNNYNVQEYDPNTLLHTYLNYYEAFQDCSQTYRSSLLRIIEKKRWTGKFYFELFVLFGFVDAFLSDLLKVVSEAKTVNGELALYDFFLAVKQVSSASQAQKYDENKKLARVYQSVLDCVFDKTFRYQVYAKEDNEYLSIVVPILSELKEIDSDTWEKYCHAVDKHIGKIFEFYNWEEYVVDENTQICIIVKYLINKISLPSSIRINLYYVVYHYSAQEYDLTSYIPHRKAFQKCPSSYKKQFLRMLEKKQWTGRFYLQLLTLFVFDEAFLPKILKTMGTSRAVNGEFVFCDFCRGFMKEYRSYKSQPQVQEERAQVISALYDAIARYYQTLQPSGWSIRGNPIYNEFEKAAKRDKALAELKDMLEPPVAKTSETDKKRGKEEPTNQKAMHSTYAPNESARHGDNMYTSDGKKRGAETQPLSWQEQGRPMGQKPQEGEQIKDYKFCKNCASVMMSNSKFCQACGQKYK